MNSLTCAICGATLQTSGDVCADASAKGWELMDGGARCKKCRMAGTSGKFRESPGNSRLTDAEIDELEWLAGEASKGPWRVDKVYIAVASPAAVLSLIAEVRAARAAGKD